MFGKRKRSQNFTVEEKDRLVKLLMEHKDTILNKRTDGTTNEAKVYAWMALTDSFNTYGSIHRSKESLMKMWEKLKSECKIYYTASRREATQTGGGPAVIKIDPILEQVCSILGRGSTGIINVPDSDYLEETVVSFSEIQKNSHPKVTILDQENVAANSIIIESKEVVSKDIEVESDGINKIPLWSRRRPVLSQINERTEAMSSLYNSFKDVNKKREDIEDLKTQLLQEEIDFKRKLYTFQLEAAAKEVEIKNEVLQRIRGGALQEGHLLGVHQNQTEK